MHDSQTTRGTGRRDFLRGTLAAGAGLGALAVAPSLAAARDRHRDDDDRRHHHHGLSKGDVDILVAAEIAEALAVTTYTGIIEQAPFFGRLEADDQAYITAARQEEMSHYALEASVTGKETPYTRFWFPKGMFDDARTTLSTLVTLEDAFIAAYLVGVRRLSTPDLRVTAARIMGIESDHRTLARVLAPAVAAQDGGPIEELVGALGVAEPVDPPNDNGYERTLHWTRIEQAVAALLPFASRDAAAKAGFDTSRAFDFVPFAPTLPSALGAFGGFAG